MVEPREDEGSAAAGGSRAAIAGGRMSAIDTRMGGAGVGDDQPPFVKLCGLVRTDCVCADLVRLCECLRDRFLSPEPERGSRGLVL